MIEKDAGNQAPARAAFSEIALRVLRERYLRRDDTGTTIEDVDGMFTRVARAIAAPARLLVRTENFGRHDFWS